MSFEFGFMYFVSASKLVRSISLVQVLLVLSQ